MFNEDNTIEQMIIQTLQKNWWHYVPAEAPKSTIKASLDSLTKIYKKDITENLR